MDLTDLEFEEIMALLEVIAEFEVVVASLKENEPFPIELGL